jgi:hypothetical protein
VNDPPAYTPIDCVSYGNFTGNIPNRDALSTRFTRFHQL